MLSCAAQVEDDWSAGSLSAAPVAPAGFLISTAWTEGPASCAGHPPIIGYASGGDGPGWDPDMDLEQQDELCLGAGLELSGKSGCPHLIP